MDASDPPHRSRLHLARLAAVTAFTILAALFMALQITGTPGPRDQAPVSVVAARGDADAGELAAADRSALIQRAFPAHFIPAGGYDRGVRESRSMASGPVEGSAWKELGPLTAPASGVKNPITGARLATSGRVTALAVDPSTCSTNGCGTIYAGSAGGGLWETRDGGRVWTPLMDGQPGLAVGAIALDPHNPRIIYVGTGAASGYGAHGTGIFRSFDGGQTWTTVGYDEFRNRAVSQIIVDPQTAGGPNATLYVASTVATSGGSTTGGGSISANPYLPRVGFSVSKDGGQTWAIENPRDARHAATAGIPAGGLLMDPLDPTVLYAGFTGDGVFESVDDGRTWSALTNGLPRSGFSEVVLTIAQNNPDVLYAAYHMDDEQTGFEEIFRSTNGGEMWSRLAGAPNACGEQCGYNLVLTVDPTDANTVYAGGYANYGYLHAERLSPCRTRLSPLPADCNTTLMKSIDGGKTWSDIAENDKAGPLHPDDHAVFIAPRNPTVIYTATDGGVFQSLDGGKSWIDLNNGLRTFQIQALAVDGEGDVYAGSQDNGTFLYRTGDTSWTHINDGDGGNTAADPQNKYFSYNSVFGASLFRNDFGGAQYKNTNIAPFWPDFQEQNRGTFYEPYAVAPSRSSDIFYGTYRVWRSKSRGGKDGNGDGSAINDRSDHTDWVPISFDLNCPAVPPAGKTCSSKDDLYEGISALAVSPTDPRVVVAGTSNGEVWIAGNALAKVKTDVGCDPRSRGGASRCNFVSGVSWTRIDGALPHRFITAVRFAPGSSSSIYVTFSGFDENTPGHSGHVFMTPNRGQSWSNLSGEASQAALPNLPFNDIVINPHNGHLYAAADYGLYLSTDNGQTWTRMDSGLPAASVYQMQFYPLGGKLLVGTYGRGVWEIPAP